MNSKENSVDSNNIVSTIKRTSNIHEDLVARESSYDQHDVDVLKLPKFHRATWEGKMRKVMKYLAVKGNLVKIDKPDYNGRTALHFASSCGNLNMVRILLTMSARGINLTDKDGFTPFFKATQIQSLECMKQLHSYGAKMDLANNAGITPAEFLVRIIGDEGLKCFKFVTQNGVQTRNKSGTSLLHSSAKFGRIAVTKYLIESQADVNVLDNNGRTPLVLAAQEDRDSIVQLLLYHGADITLKDKAKKDVMSYVKKGSRSSLLLRDFKTSVDEVGRKSNEVYVHCNNGSRYGQCLYSKADHGPQESNCNRKSEQLKVMIHQIEREIENNEKYYEEEESRNLRLSQQVEDLCNSNAANKSDMETKNIRSSASIVELEAQVKLKYSLRACFSKQFRSWEEWSSAYNGLVDRFDQLQRAYEKLLLVESEKELSVEIKTDEFMSKKTELSSVKKEVKLLREELKTINGNMQSLAARKNSLRAEIHTLNELVPKEKQRFQNVKRHADAKVVQLNKELSITTNESNRKSEELFKLKSEEDKFKKLIGQQLDEIDEQNQSKERLRNKINNLKAKYKSLKQCCIENASD